MKGLLLKDFYVTIKSCKMYFIVVLMFIAMSFFFNDSFSDGYMFLMLPVMMFGALPISLLSFDEKFKWTKYSKALPYSPTQIVSSKYLFGFIFQVLMALIVLLALVIRVETIGGETLSTSASVLCRVFTLSLIIPAIGLPLCFKFGTEKGRVFYMALVFGLALAFSVSVDKLAGIISSKNFVLIMIAAVTALYALSWFISVAIYGKREITG